MLAVMAVMFSSTPLNRSSMASNRASNFLSIASNLGSSAAETSSTIRWICTSSMAVLVRGAFCTLLGLLYTQTLPKSDRITLIRTLEIVYHYDLEAFAASVWHALVRKLDGVVAVRALRVAGLHQNKEISAEAMEFIKEHILTLMLDREWVRRYADVLEEITDPGRPSLGT